MQKMLPDLPAIRKQAPGGTAAPGSRKFQISSFQSNCCRILGR